MVESSEAVRRIFWRHRWLLLILMIVPVVVVVPLKERAQVRYAAAATIQGQGTTPDADTQVQAIQSRVTAVASDPALIQGVISQAKVNRNATQVARHEISVTPLGSSAIMVLTVTDPSSRAAMTLATSLANAVVNALNQLGVKDDPELASLGKTGVELGTKRDQLLTELHSASASNAATSVQVQSLLSQLAAVEQEQVTNESAAQQILATLTAETGASVVSVPTYAAGASRHVAVDGALAGLLGLVIGLLIAAVREVIRPTVGQPGAGARELGAVLLGGADARGNQIVGVDQDLSERLNLAAHRAGVLTTVLTGPGSRERLSALAARLRDELPPPEQADARSPWMRTAARIDHGHVGDEPGVNGDARRAAGLDGGHRPVGVATDRPTDIAARIPKPHRPHRTVVTLNDVRLGAPPPDAALVVVLPRFAPHGALDQAADLGVTADWPILGVIGIRRRGWLATHTGRSAASPDAQVLDARRPEAQDPDTVPDLRVPDDIHMERKDD
jgi:capsular polysaccharide biosynthesis protein